MSEQENRPREATVDERLRQLAGHLDSHLAARLLALLAADAVASEVIDLRGRTQRAEDLAAECRRQLRSRDKQCEELQQRLALTPPAVPADGAGGERDGD